MAKSIKLQASENDGLVASKDVASKDVEEFDSKSKQDKPPASRNQRESDVTRSADERYEKDQAE